MQRCSVAVDYDGGPLEGPSRAPMPSQLHEVLASLVRDRPQLAVTLVKRALGIDLGSSAARVSSETLSELEPAEYRADAVFELVIDGEDRPTRALIVEV